MMLTEDLANKNQKGQTVTFAFDERSLTTLDNMTTGAEGYYSIADFLSKYTPVTIRHPLTGEEIQIFIPKVKAR